MESFRISRRTNESQRTAENWGLLPVKRYEHLTGAGIKKGALPKESAFEPLEESSAGLLFVGDSGLSGSQASQRHTVGAARNIVETNLVEGLDRVRIAAMFATHAAHQVGIALVTQLNAHLHELGNARVDGRERVVRQQLLSEVLRNELSLNVVAAEAERRLGEVVGTEAEEVGLAWRFHQRSRQHEAAQS